MTIVHLPVGGMTCEHCERRVEAALAQVGAIEPRADCAGELAVFGFEGDLFPAIAAVREAGYEPGEPSVNSEEKE